MDRRVRGSWRGLYALLPITVVLLYFASTTRMAEILHQILLVVVVIVVALLALLWTEHHRDLMGSEGVDAQAEEDSLRALGVNPNRFVPSLTARQANYRRMMLSRGRDESRYRAGELP